MSFLTASSYGRACCVCNTPGNSVEKWLADCHTAPEWEFVTSVHRVRHGTASTLVLLLLLLVSHSSHPLSFLKIIFQFLKFYLYECFACIFVCVLPSCLMPREVRREYQIPFRFFQTGNKTPFLCKNSKCP